MMFDDEEFIVFDPDLELEWEVGPDNEVRFEPERTEPMTAASSAGWMFTLACFAGILFTMHRRKLGSSVFCPRCGNPRQLHKRDCPEGRR